MSKSPLQLSIPSPQDGIEPIKERLALLQRVGGFPDSELRDVLTQLKNLDDSTKDKWLQLTLADENQIDDFEVATMVVTNWLLNADMISEELVLFFDRTTRVLIEQDVTTREKLLSQKPNYFADTRSNFKSLGETLVKNDLPRIRAKMAYLELIALIRPLEMIPHLVGLTLKYLSSKAVIARMEVARYQFQFGSGDQSKIAGDFLDQIAKAQKGDRRKKKRNYSYWALDRSYQTLQNHINGFRTKGGDSKMLDTFCSLWNIPNEYKTLIMDSNQPPGELAKGLLVACDMVESEKAFSTIQTKLSKQKTKHGYRVITPVLEEFLDLPTLHPEIVARQDYWGVLNRVTP